MVSNIEQPGDPTTYTPIQKRIFDELAELQKLEKLNPRDDEQSRKTFLDNFDWSDTTLNLFGRQKVEELLVEFHDIFARHRFDIGTNREFKVKLTPNDDRPAFSQSLPTPINLKYDITVELAAITMTQLCINVRAVFECIRNASLKLSMSKCHFGVKQVNFLGRTITPKVVSPQVDKVKDFLAKPKFPKSQKGLHRLLVFLKLYTTRFGTTRPFLQFTKGNQQILHFH